MGVRATRLSARWQQRRAAWHLDRSQSARHPEPDQLVTDPRGRCLIVRAVGTDDELDRQTNRNIADFLFALVEFLVRSAYRAVRRRPQRTPGYVVGVVDLRPLRGGVIHSEPVFLESEVADKLAELADRARAGEFSRSTG